MSKIDELLARVGVDVGYCPDGWIELEQEVQKLLAVVRAAKESISKPLSNGLRSDEYEFKRAKGHAKKLGRAIAALEDGE